MPPDDALFTAKEGDAAPVADAAAGGTPTPAAEAASVSAQFEAAAEKTFGPIFSGMATTLQAIDQRLGILEKPDAAAAEEAAKAADPTAVESELIADPNAFVTNRAKAAAAEIVAPIFQNLAEDKFNAMETSIKAEIDSQFGEGAFDEVFRDDARRVVGTLPVEMRASENHYRSAINGIKGMKWDDLQEKQTKATSNNAAEERRQSFRPLEGGRSRPAAGQLTEEEAGYLADLAQHGIEYTRDEFIRDRDAPKTASAFPKPKEATS